MRPVGDDAFSAQSSMDDSAYGSLSATTRRHSKQTAEYRMGQDVFFPQESEGSPTQGMFSPAISSSAWSNHNQQEATSLMLPVSSNGSISGEINNLAPAQDSLWPAQGTPVPTNVNVAFPSTVESPMAVRPAALAQTSAFGQSSQMHATNDGFAAESFSLDSHQQISFGPSASPDQAVRSMAPPSRASSRATLSGYASASSGAAQQIPYHRPTSREIQPTAAMMRRASSGMSSHFTGPSLSPTSPFSVEQTSPVDNLHWRDEYSEYLNFEMYEHVVALQSQLADEVLRSTVTSLANDLPNDTLVGLEGSLKEEFVMEDSFIEDSDDIRPIIDENARSDPLYSTNADKDGFYQCPFLDKEHCDHKPTRLKCNYDKYIDSHLRPFRCKEADCSGIPFSSTACLLRHQREAHGMYGHGQKPYLCEYADCERSKDGQGFPRKYNLYDHMKRVHNHTGSINDQPQGATKRVVAMGRRRNPPGSADPKSSRVEKRAKPTKAEIEAQNAAKKQKFLQSLRHQWMQRKNSVMDRVHALQSPEDLVALEQIREDLAAMERISATLGETG